MNTPAPAHFPWERLVLCLIGLGILYVSAYIFRDWVSYYVLLDPAKTASREGISALTIQNGTLMGCVAAIVIFFITGSTRTLSDMFKFNVSNIGSSAISASSQDDTVTESVHIPKAAHFDDLDEIP